MAGPQRHTSRGFLLWLQYFALVGVVSGSHFRYGTLNWQALTTTSIDSGGLRREIEMTLQAAYRRDYNWGANFGERWKQLSNLQSSSIWYGNERVNGELDTTNVDCSAANPTAACYECPTSVAGIEATAITTTDNGCINNAPRFDVGVGDSNANGISGEKFFIKFPRLKQTNGEAIVQCPSPFTCDIVLNGADNSAQLALCGDYANNPGRTDPNKCAPWDQVYGMFYGDEDGAGVDVELEVTMVDEGTTTDGVQSVIGNFIQGKATFTHFYYVNSATPYTAYFTGGDRVYECGGSTSVEATGLMSDTGDCQNQLRLMLNNNAEGRFRLETSVWLKSTLENRSPRVTMIPIVPVPRASATSRSRFQVAAYDPDNDALRYRFGNEEEYGGIMRSKSEAFGFGVDNGLGAGFVYGPFECNAATNSFVQTGTCPTDRTPSGPPGTDGSFDTAADSIPGLIVWNTFDTAAINSAFCPVDNAACSKLREGLYNFVVMVEDIPETTDYFLAGNPSSLPSDASKSKVPVDFMAYLYDGPMYYCDAGCTSSTGTATYANLDGAYDSCAICGMGPLAAFNSTVVCQAGASAGTCAEVGGDGVTLVPPADACKINQAPQFISVNGKEDNLIDTPEVSKWEAAHAAVLNAGLNNVDLGGTFEYPQISQYYGADVEFYVTAIDYDECTTLTLESTGLPETFSTAPGDWREATLGEYIYPTSASGRMVRRKFTWQAPPGSNLNAGIDTRDPTTLVCFTAYDVYFATADPFYCVNVNLREKPAAEEETLLRFECKMALLWSPVVNRFVFADDTTKYYTVCRYEEYEWHHALVAIDGDGRGQLYVDGEPQDLMVAKEPTDLSAGFDPAALGDAFETTMFPTSCISAGRRRSLLEEETGEDLEVGNAEGMGAATRDLLGLTFNPDRMGLNDFSDQPVNDTFADVDPAANAGLTCCNFKIGLKCQEGETNEYRSFAGLLDEVAVWNRMLRPEEVKTTLFKMPQRVQERELEGPRGVQIDYTSGRVLYTRFNNPCMESPEQAPPPPFPPPPPCNNEGCFRRRRLQQQQQARRRSLLQISDHEIGLNLPGGDRGPDMKYSPPPPVGGNAGRRDYIADDAQLTAGVRNADGTTEMIDPSNRAGTIENQSWLRNLFNQQINTVLNVDAALLSDFPYNSKYIYTGVPWIAPMVTAVTSTATTSTVTKESAMPLDGGMDVHVHGVGFARSAFTKCVLVQPDPAGLYEKQPEYLNPDHVKGDYDNYYRAQAGGTRYGTGTYSVSEASAQVMKTPASMVFMKGTDIPYIHNYDDHSPLDSFHTTNLWDVDLVDTREGNIPAFQTDKFDSHSLDFVFGGWEVVKCPLPPAAFPSDRYHLGVSNDAGLTASPDSFHAKFMDHSIALGGDSSFTIDAVRAQLGSVFSISMWVYPTFEPASTSAADRQTILEMGDTGGSTGIVYDGTLKAILDSSLQSPAANASAVNMWHFVMIVFDGNRASFYLDGSDEFSFGGGGSTRTWPGFSAAGPPKMEFGAGFFGLLDEVKMYKRAVSFAELMDNDLMYTRGLPGPPAEVFAYYRFNQLTDYIDPAAKAIKDEFQQYDGVVDGGVAQYQYEPMAVPWEPSSVYEVNGADVLERFAIQKAPQTGMGGDVQVTGFNLAHSFASGCTWGVDREMAATTFTVEAEAQQPETCVIPDAEALDINSGVATETFAYGEGSLGRVDGKAPLMLPYPVSMVSGAVAFSPAATVSDDGTAMSCPAAAVAKPQFATFSAGAGPTLSAVPFEFTEVALSCEGDNYLDASEMTRNVGNKAYTIAAWVMPAAEEDHGDDASDPMSVAGRRRRSLLSTDKNLRRKLMGHESRVASTVWAFESEGKNDALLMYDGERFFYYDDCILDVTQTGAPAKAGEWHYVAVSVDLEGNAILNVDGFAAEEFTTTCKPKPTGTFSVCQDFEAAAPATAASHFVGLVDEIKIWDREMDYAMTMTYMFEPYDFFIADPVGYYPFSDAGNMLPDQAIPVGGERWAEASGPWLPATVVATHPEVAGISGGTSVSIFGTNLAPSPHLRVAFGDEIVPVDAFVASGVVATTPDADCGGNATAAVVNLPAEMTTPAYAAYFDALANGVAPEGVDYVPTVEDLAKDVFARFTFDYTAGVTDGEGNFVLSVDLAAPPADLEDVELDPSAGVLLPNSTHFFIPMDRLTKDKDEFEKSAARFGAGYEVPLPMPHGAEWTLAAWLFLDLVEPHPPMAGAWKLVSLTQREDGTHAVHMNGEEVDAATTEYYVGILSDFTLGNNEAGVVDEVWVYARALLQCELRALYYTQEFALDFAKGGDKLMQAPAHLTLPVAAGKLKFTMSMWVYPFKTEGLQTLASTDGSKMFDTMDRSLGLTFGLFDNALSFDIHKGCSCQPCPGVITLTSAKAKVTPFEWNHVSFVFPFGHEFPGMEETTMAIYVDGILRDIKEIPDVDIPDVPADTELTLLLGQHSTAPLNFQPFAGMIYDVRWTKDALYNYQVKKMMQCPPKEREENEVYFELDVGSGALDASGAAMGLMGLWTNTSYDDPTSPASVTFNGDMATKVAGAVGRIVITSRTACQKKRVVGGDAYEVSLTHPDGQVDQLPVVDTNDGNYHVEYTDVTCGTYATSISLAGQQLNTFDIDIVPGPTDPTRTFIVDQLPTPSCYGAVTEFMIQAQDNYGCAQVGHDDVFVVKINGPHAADAVVTPVAATGGRYKVSFVPEAPGNYHLTVFMSDPATGEARQIMDGMYFCISVCGEGALELADAAGVLVQEDMEGVSDLDLSFPGVTMELWVKLAADTVFPREGTMYLLHKGGPDQQDKYTKTYDLMIRGSGEIFASVYVGPGEIRSVVLPAADAGPLLVPDQWVHVAAVYTGFEFSILVNGVSGLATSPFTEPKPVKTNFYLHPLEIGANMAGSKVDEVKLWKVARTPEQIADAMYCAPYQSIDHVAAYFSFNEGTGAVVAGHGAQCPHTSLAAHDGLCLQGAVPAGAVFTADTPVLTAGEGYNAPSPKYSLLQGPGLTVYPAGSTDLQYQVMARDKCNFNWIKFSPEAYTAVTAEYKIEYVSTTPPVADVEYPLFAVSDTKSEPVFATPPPSRQCPETGPVDPTPGPYLGDVYNGTFATQVIAPTTVAGSYMLEIAVDGVLHESSPTLITVIANDPHHFFVMPVDSGLFAGVPAAFNVQMKDAHDNTIYHKMELTAKVSLLATLDGTATPYDTVETGEVVQFDTETGFYTVAVRLGYPGTYSLVLSGEGEAAAMTAFSMSFTVNAASWRPMLTNDMEVPPHSKRFEHTAAVYEDDLYIFGGALHDRTYLNDMWKLTNVSTDAMFAFKETLAFEYSLSEEKDLTVEVRVDTAARVAASRMNPTCLDVVFTLPNNGAMLDFYLDPSPGCDSDSTLYWVKLPAGSVKPEGNEMLFEMYYGNPSVGVEEENMFNDPRKVFLMYEGFEDQFAQTGAFKPGEVACRADPAEAVAEAQETFFVAEDLAFSGDRSLHVKWGSTGMLVWKAPMPTHRFKLRAWFYDTAATHSTHYISPDFAECDAKEGDKLVLPMAHGPLEAVSTAVGTYTLAHTDKYCIASPWESATADPAAGTQTVFRSAGWHQFEVTSAYGRLVVSIDGHPVKNVSSAEGETTLEHVMLSAGFTEDQVSAAGQNANHAYWDEISVVLVEDGVGPVRSVSAEEPETVALGGDRKWVKVEAHNPPPPRYAHSAVVFEDTMYIFGGERSAYAFNDVWAYSFADEKWSFVTPTAGPAPAARYDHAAAVTADGVMIVYGGRNGAKALGDMWAFDIKSSTWTLLRDEAAQEAGARFGHSAAIPAGGSDMYVFGGYKEASGFAGDFWKCSLEDGECTDMTQGCPTMEVGGAAGGFLPAELGPRYEHASFADARFVYVYGGASLASTEGFPGVFKFAVTECSWEKVETNGLPVGRYEHVAGLVDGGMYVHGGHANGDFVDETYFFPL